MSYDSWKEMLPGPWKAKPLRSLAEYSVSNVDKLSAEDEISVRLCNYADVYNNQFISLGLDFMQATATEEEIAKFCLQTQDVLITKDSESWDDIGIPALVRATASDLVCGYHLAIIRPKVDVLMGEYLLRCLQSKCIRLQLELAANGVTRYGIPKSAIGSLTVPVPPLPEQKAIVDYLNLETERLDSLAAAKERQILLLRQKSASIITAAVTRGLNPDVAFQESDIPWLGPIPAHSEIERTRWLFEERDDRSETGQEELLTVSHLTGVTLRSEKNVNMFEAESTEGYKVCHKNDLVINTLWAWMGAMGVARVHGIVSPAYHVYPRGVFRHQRRTYSPRRRATLSTLIARHSEAAFETVMESSLVGNGYIQISREGFDRQRAIFPEVILAFIRETQPREWSKLEALHGDRTGEQILSDLCKWMDINGATHRYSMRQAIEEGFILDVLKNYTTYATYFKLLKASEQDPNVERKKAAKALARFMRLHPHNIAQKTEVIIEHFQAVTRHKIGGKAKAMVVTGSRLEAVRYKQSFDKYIRARGYSIKSLVAFSGKVQDDKLKNIVYTEPGLNGGISEKELPERFASQEFQVLLVAEKYQTGFDQPLLHTMFVDKRLAGIQAVQTLSRLNRTHPLKEDTFVLDFVNSPEEIREAFKTYYEGSTMGEEVDPVRLYTIKEELDNTGLYLDEEIARFSDVYFKPKAKQSVADHQSMNAALDPAVSRFTVRAGDSPEEMELIRGKIQAFLNLYAFLSQIIPYQDSDLEKLYVFLRHLSAKLPKRDTGEAYEFDDEIKLEYYRLQKISEGSISLRDGVAPGLDGPTELGGAVARPQSVPLSQLIDVVNDRFGTEFGQADQLFFDQIVAAAITDSGLRQAALVNPSEKFELVFKNLLDKLFIERMDQNEEIFVRFMNEGPFQRTVTEWLASEAYRQLNADGGVKHD